MRFSLSSNDRVLELSSSSNCLLGRSAFALLRLRFCLSRQRSRANSHAENDITSPMKDLSKIMNRQTTYPRWLPVHVIRTEDTEGDSTSYCGACDGVLAIDMELGRS